MRQAARRMPHQTQSAPASTNSSRSWDVRTTLRGRREFPRHVNELSRSPVGSGRAPCDDKCCDSTFASSNPPTPATQLRVLERFSSWPFVVYRFALGVIILGGAMVGWLS